eukprot:SM000007S20870  [mRNA]  locus=s7:657624:664039:- [translate_table: standard]
MVLLTPARAGTAEGWRRALARVVPAVVVLRVTAVRAFDGEAAGSAHATGFVVDKRRGLLLTNRHVARPGPAVAEATFVDREEVPAAPLYRDPVHDFAFLRFDPAAVQFLAFDAIPLAPAAAAVGLEVRVVGNDSGEKVSILAGTLARLDRDAPHYRKDGYNDFNTFYMQAASGTKGGSSGSPVVDVHGRAVALNAGSKSSSASAFFLPLERVVRALELLQASMDERETGGGPWAPVVIPRGTLQATLLHKGFDETRRLGLRHEVEEAVRAEKGGAEVGMLVVDSVVPNGPAHGRLEPGDVLVRVNGKVMTSFLELEEVLDGRVGSEVALEVDRGGTPIVLAVAVQDLHSVTPALFLELAGGVLHALSYQQARNFRFATGAGAGGVYVAEPGYALARAGLPKHALLTRLAGLPTPDLATLHAALADLPPGARVPLEYRTAVDRHRSKSALLTIDRHEWHAPPEVYERDDGTGLWNVRPASHALASSEVGREEGEGGNGEKKRIVVKDEEGNLADAAVPSSAPLAAAVKDVDLAPPGGCNSDDLRRQPASSRHGEDGSVSGRNLPSLAEHVVEAALVMLEVHIPPTAMLDGVHSQHFFGTGVVVHHDASGGLGIVAVDRNTVAVSAGDVVLSFAAYPAEVPGEVVFLHPLHNFAFVAYDPAALGSAGAAAVKAAVLRPELPLSRGEVVNLVGLSRSLQATSRKSVVTNACAAPAVSAADCPRYRAMNIEVIELDTDFGHTFSGVLADDEGCVQGLWASFSTQMKYTDGSAPEDHQFVRGIGVRSILAFLCTIVEGRNSGQSPTDGPKLAILGRLTRMPLVLLLEAELQPTLLSKARSFGLSEAWVQALARKDPLRRQVLRVKGCFAGGKARSVLEEGDMLLATDTVGPVTCFQDVEEACEAAEADRSIHLTIFRRVLIAPPFQCRYPQLASLQGIEMELKVGLDVRDGFGTDRLVNWAGCMLQAPHLAVRAMGFLPDNGSGVYIGRWCHGSPAHRYGLYALQWIVEVNGRPTSDLDTFLAVAKELEHGAFVRVRTVHLNGKPKVLTLKQDLHYWPTWELYLDRWTATWRRRVIKGHC